MEAYKPDAIARPPFSRGWYHCPDVQAEREGEEDGGGWRVTKSHTSHRRLMERHERQLGKAAQLLHLLVPCLQVALPGALSGAGGGGSEGEGRRTRARRAAR